MCAVCGCSGETDAAHEHHDPEHSHSHEHGHGHSHTHPEPAAAPGFSDGVHSLADASVFDATHAAPTVPPGDTFDHTPPHAGFSDGVHSLADGGAHEHSHAFLPPLPAQRTAQAPALRTLQKQVLARNDEGAARNRALLRSRGVLALNLMSSPGAGKTTLLERAIRDLRPLSLYVIEGDQETERDAERIRAAGAQALQINTGAGCHLDAAMVERALAALDPPPNALLMIENVGNLVCPSLFDLGEDARVVIASVTEGEDKPLKYPHMFRVAHAVVLNKVDLLPHVTFDVEQFIVNAKRVNPAVEVILLSAATGVGMEGFYAWLDRRRLLRVPELPAHGARGHDHEHR